MGKCLFPELSDVREFGINGAPVNGEMVACGDTSGWMEMVLGEFLFLLVLLHMVSTLANSGFPRNLLGSQLSHR